MTILACSVDGCEGPAKTRGWCRYHYQKQYRGKPLTERHITSICPGCSKEFRVAYGRTYCSQRCREVSKHAEAPRVPCTACGGPTGYKVGIVASATCNPCRRKHWEHGTDKGYRDNKCRCELCRKWNTETRREYVKRRASGELPMKPCSDPNCERGAQSRGMCLMHYRRWARANGMENPPSAAWNDNRRSNHHARRARLKGATRNNKVMIQALLERDGATCTWCNEPIDMTLTYPDRYSKSVDHTLPLVHGGTHSLENTTLMHLTCNLSKGAKVLAHKE